MYTPPPRASKFFVNEDELGINVQSDLSMKTITVFSKVLSTIIKPSCGIAIVLTMVGWPPNHPFPKF